MGNLQAAIAEANLKAGRERQKVFAKKSYLRTSQATRTENLCQRAEELIREVYRCIESGRTTEVARAIDAVELAIKIDRREREQGR